MDFLPNWKRVWQFLGTKMRSRPMGGSLQTINNPSPHSAGASTFFLGPRLNRADNACRAASSPSPLPATFKKAYPSSEPVIKSLPSASCESRIFS
ncbi:hypothetical protein EPIRMAN_GEN20615_02185 [Ralstonia mannitolilytica]|nr:hypothetical protein R77555_02440 [Ralstonia mannitolilytica]